MRAFARPLAGAALVALWLAVTATGGAAATPPAGPSCTPQTLGASALLDGAVTVSPMPGAADASPQTQISFLGVPAGAISQIVVTASHSGVHDGTLEPYSQGDGGSFVPRAPFDPGDHVTVTARVALSSGPQPLRFAFTVAYPDRLPATPATLHRVASGSVQQFHSRPDLSPPIVTVHTRSNAQAAGETLLAPYGVPAQAGPMILDPSGGLVWFHPLPRPMVATDLNVQQLDGSPVLTWWQGTITNHGFGLGVDEVVAPDYHSLATVRAGNGLQADLHEFQITPAGTALLTAYNPIRCDLAPFGGARDAAITDSLLQEIDIRTGLVMFEWTPLDHVPVGDSYSQIANGSTAWPVDFFHLNSIDLAPDGSLLVSSRNTWAVDDIDAATGQVLWRLGGKHSSYTEGRGAATAYQHDARVIGSGSLTLFDNGASPQVHLQSRGVVLAIDPSSHAVSVQAQFLHPGRRLLADSQGDLQAVPGGDWFIGWGQEPDVSEFSAAGTLLFDASMPSGYESYRALCQPWSGTPASVPALAIAAAPGGHGTDAYMSWNGATGVASWQLEEGRTAGALAPVATARRAGFETAMALGTTGGQRYAAVQALNASGVVLASSSVVALPR